jgi:hypothetical protein
MFDPEVLAHCRDCLIGAVLAPASEDDLLLVATAMSRDLSDTHQADARGLLAAAARGATSMLDASDLSARAFSAALSRLAGLQLRVTQALPAPGGLSQRLA